MEEDMPQLQWNQRFFASTRGRIILLLRRASRTVDELAQALNLTDNAVRSHLATLERDGFVQQLGERRGSGKPSYVYDLTPGAEQLFPKAYGQVMREILEELNERLTATEVEEIMRSTGRRLAAQWPIPRGELPGRVEAAVSVLNALGGLAELEKSNGNYVICGYSCPLAAVVPGHPEACNLAASLLTGLVGVNVQQKCDRHESIQCRFIVPAPGSETTI